MYDLADPLRGAGRLVERPGAADGTATRHALARVRKFLGGWLPGMRCDHVRWRQAVQMTLAEPALERERLFCLGWLAWLAGDWGSAEGRLREADERCRTAPADEATPKELPALESGLLAARSAYWLARVRVLLGRTDGLAEYESALRRLGGSPQATAWYVDLLWRAGRVDRAEQVWKAVRSNKRVLGCDEGPLFDVRLHLRRGELGPAEKLLRESAPASGVVWVEKHLLLAWALAGPRQGERALEALRQASDGPYPAAALAAWRAMLEGRLRGEPVEGTVTAPGWREYVAGQKARAGGNGEEARRAYRAALEVPAVAPFARYGLACFGEEDPAAVLAAAPGVFHAVRCRARLAVERFRRRETGAAELLDALQQAGNADCAVGGAYRAVAAALLQRQLTSADLAALVRDAGEGPARRNAIRIGMELAVGRLDRVEAERLLNDWGRETSDPLLCEAITRQFLRFEVLGRDAEEWNGVPGHLRALISRVPRVADVDGEHPAGLLWHAAWQIVQFGEPKADVAAVCEVPSYCHLALALLVYHAASRRDLAAVARLLEDGSAWAAFRGGPPGFVVRALAWLAGSQPAHSLWRERLPAWLGLWDGLAPGAGVLAAVAGVAGGESAEAPPGVEPGPWFLHQAARALVRDDAVSALAFAQRAQERGAVEVDAVLPQLERRADAQSLARCLPDQPAAALLVDLIDLLRELPPGDEVLERARAGDADGVRQRLEAWLDRPDLGGRLCHHLALVLWRAARAEEQRHVTSPGRWRAAWRGWLAFLASAEAPPEAARAALLDHLLGQHRDRINDLLARSDLEQARLHWESVQALPDCVPAGADTLADEVRHRVGRFRDEMATASLLTTREAMRFGAIPEGWRADYDRGLSLLRRVLSLDRDNARLLTALVEACGEWFLDLYHTHELARLAEEVGRYTPLAVRLARQVEDRTGELAARSALAEFYKFRGFVESDHAARAALYREALRFNPNNENVRELLADMGEAVPPSEGDDV